MNPLNTISAKLALYIGVKLTTDLFITSLTFVDFLGTLAVPLYGELLDSDTSSIGF